MKDKMIEGASIFFGLDIEKLRKLAEEKDLYSAISELSGMPRPTIKSWMHGLAYSVKEEELNDLSNS